MGHESLSCQVCPPTRGNFRKDCKIRGRSLACKLQRLVINCTTSFYYTEEQCFSVITDMSLV
jgi:hypothetical protein